jgi:hypothetical protein
VTKCKYGDDGCPCQDGDQCHYETYEDSLAIRICGNCEYFDNGKGENDRSGRGDCLNNNSDRFNTYALSCCENWVPGT